MFAVQPKSIDTNAFFQVRHPRCTNINDRSTYTCYTETAYITSLTRQNNQHKNYSGLVPIQMQNLLLSTYFQ